MPASATGERFVAEHGDWLAKQLARFQLDGVPALERDVSAQMPLRGAMLPLQWQQGRFARCSYESDGEALVFTVPSRAGDSAVRRVAARFLRSAGARRRRPLVAALLATCHARRGGSRFKMMSSQWGSLAPDGSMALDLSLVLARPSAFEYVLVHELCHLIRADHSRAFWREVEARFPHWREERDYFHAEGRRLKATLRALCGKAR